MSVCGNRNETVLACKNCNILEKDEWHPCFSNGTGKEPEGTTYEQIKTGLKLGNKIFEAISGRAQEGKPNGINEASVNPDALPPEPEGTGEGLSEAKSVFTQLNKRELLFICLDCKHINCISDADINECLCVKEYKELITQAKADLLDRIESEIPKNWSCEPPVCEQCLLINEVKAILTQIRGEK